MDASRNGQFHDLILRLTDGKEPVEDIEREIWDRFGFEGAVLVTDLSGFTQLTRAKGILHYLLVIRRAAQLTSLEVERSGGSVVKTDADNVIAVFSTANAAVEAAAAIQASCEEHNRIESREGRIGICIGVSSGRMLRLDGDIYGDPVNTAYKLGEDLARPGQTYVASAAAALVIPRSDSPLAFSEERSQPVGGVPLLYRELLRDS